MIDPKDFVKAFKKQNINYFVGVPDSVLDTFINFLHSQKRGLTHRVAANEGGAIGLATGYAISKKRIPVVYFQNSGLGNAINPLTSIVDKKVYGIPMILVIGVRGGFNFRDELQHHKMGPITLKILKSLGIPYKVVNEKKFNHQIRHALKYSKNNSQPFALIIKHNSFKKQKNHKIFGKQKEKFRRYEYIEVLLKNLKKNTYLVGSTGFATRELNYFAKNLNLNTSKFFYCIGAMGHANQIANEIALQKKKNKVIILDGDGALIMHLGNLSTIKKTMPRNLIHIVFDNKIHESTGGHPVSDTNLNFKLIFKAFGYKKIFEINNPNKLVNILKNKKLVNTAVIIKTKPGTINNLPRPSLKDLIYFKKNF